MAYNTCLLDNNTIMYMTATVNDVGVIYVRPSPIIRWQFELFDPSNSTTRTYIEFKIIRQLLPTRTIEK